MKYRIVEKSYSDHKEYLIQYRLFFIWINCTYPSSEASFSDVTYPTIEMAREYIARNTNVTEKVIASKVVETY